MTEERTGPDSPPSFHGLRIDALVEAAGRGCCCPSAAGRCSPPWDLQPAVLGVPPAAFSEAQEVAALLAGAVLEHLRDGRSGVALAHAGHLAELLRDRPGDRRATP